jgi:hypothetical protein
MKIANFLRNNFGKIKETQGSLITRIFKFSKKEKPHKAFLISKFYFMKTVHSFRNMFREIKETQGSLIPRIFTFSKKKNPTNNP